MTPDRRTFLSAGAVAALVPSTGRAEPEPKVAKPGQTKNTKFAVNIEMWWRKERDYLKRLEAAAALGFNAVELWPWENKDQNAVAETCERLGIKIVQFTAWGFKPGLNDPKNHNQFVEKIEKGCEVAKKWKCSMMCVVAGDDIKDVPQEKMHENVIEGLKKGAPIAQKHGITLILEPMNIRVDHKGHCLYGSAPTLKIVKEVNSKYVKILWDLYHMHITEGDLCGHLREGFAADMVGYIQLADHPGRNEPGTGEIHYPRVLKELKALKYTGYVGLECTPLGTEEAAAQAVYAADNW
ncbi:Hydroxypyruvate isomerase OS=Isosphaera pallida (strain ATCC 43644 / DSM 9630 / IS1B) GN=Isop_2183 PE=4 SV=1: AP_endonuc_2 [Gemmata massiliana]|uniref:Xylose isomerase-like TIM barrel domain-containing protein n=1 Tax=Gemmata massiliana TaxID=1210884 RepID=A0A6P2CUV1_9BACT|nr:TIM barrel protein [Gemmata massiliana]VTR90960.1 Hydroxypyruvate isomerase OS=Isosphaera pallida (strain ATCC 43644 / DSM 9630 / IS1B) GN=Isop_2183 PE=4 SV=1: AP_endonuc_2 [Gemmata massiliana]